MMPRLSDIEKELIRNTSLEDLEMKLKPQEEGHPWKDASGGGFLAPDEKLLQVIRRDHKTLIDLGKNYQEMAKICHDFLQDNKKLDRSQTRTQRILAKLIGMIFSEADHRLIKYDRERFGTRKIFSMGSQSCPWGCKEDKDGYEIAGNGHIYIMNKTDTGDLEKRYLKGMWEMMKKEYPDMEYEEAKKVRKEEEDEFMKSLGVEYGDISRLLYLSAYSVVTDLTPHLVSKHYFFQGDSAFRTDPRKLMEFVNSGNR